MSEVENNILRRASIRAYTGEDLSGEALIELVEAGLAAPWAYHRHARHQLETQAGSNGQKRCSPDFAKGHSDFRFSDPAFYAARPGLCRLTGHTGY